MAIRPPEPTSPPIRTSAPVCPSTASTAQRGGPAPRCSTASTCCCSTSRTSARARTPTSRRWRTSCRPPPRMVRDVWILDRPNPTGGNVVEGPVLDPKFSSFIGLYAIAMRHGMTVGELARMFNDRFAIGCALKVVAMQRWRRTMFWPDTGLGWVQTSPNIPDWETTLVYPATGLIDDAGLNNGTNFTSPSCTPARYRLDGRSWRTRSTPGRSRASTSGPPRGRRFAGFWAGKKLSGVELVVTDRPAFRSVRTAVEILVAARRIAPGRPSRSTPQPRPRLGDGYAAARTRCRQRRRRDHRRAGKAHAGVRSLPRALSPVRLSRTQPAGRLLLAGRRRRRGLLLLRR